MNGPGPGSRGHSQLLLWVSPSKVISNWATFTPSPGFPLFFLLSVIQTKGRKTIHSFLSYFLKCHFFSLFLQAHPLPFLHWFSSLAETHDLSLDCLIISRRACQRFVNFLLSTYPVPFLKLWRYQISSYPLHFHTCLLVFFSCQDKDALFHSVT